MMRLMPGPEVSNLSLWSHMDFFVRIGWRWFVPSVGSGVLWARPWAGWSRCSLRPERYGSGARRPCAGVGSIGATSHDMGVSMCFGWCRVASRCPPFITRLTRAGSGRGRVSVCSCEPVAMRVSSVDALAGSSHYWHVGFSSRMRHLFACASGDPGRIRTCDLPLRRRLLYPAELRGRCRTFFVANWLACKGRRDVSQYPRLSGPLIRRLEVSRMSRRLGA